MSEDGPIELPISGHQVWCVGVSSGTLRLEFQGQGPGSAHFDLSLNIEGPFSLSSGDSVVSADPQAGPAPVALRLVEKQVTRAVAEQDGSLQVEFADGDVLTIPPDQFEPWQLESWREGPIIVSVAGGGLAIWDYKNDPAAAQRERLRQQLDRLVREPRLHLPSSHFAVAVAYLTALDGGPLGNTLRDFGKWLGSPGIVWWAQIERIATGAGESGPGGVSDMVDRLSARDSEKCVEALSIAMNSYVAGEPSPRRRS